MCVKFSRLTPAYFHVPPVPSFFKRYVRETRALPISSSRAESTVNVLVKARMNKLRYMRGSPRDAQRVLQGRAAVIDGRLRAGSLSLPA